MPRPARLPTDAEVAALIAELRESVAEMDEMIAARRRERFQPESSTVLPRTAPGG